jgi:preprotein translocase subunit SecA
MVKKIIETFFGSKHEKDLQELLPILHRVNEREKWAMASITGSLKPELHISGNAWKKGRASTIYFLKLLLL